MLACTGPFRKRERSPTAVKKKGPDSLTEVMKSGPQKEEMAFSSSVARAGWSQFGENGPDSAVGEDQGAVFHSSPSSGRE